MPKTPLSLTIGVFIVSVGAMPAPAFTAIPSFQMILFGKNLVAFGREVIITFFQWYIFPHGLSSSSQSYV